jgi:hypothetical protein
MQPYLVDFRTAINFLKLKVLDLENLAWIWILDGMLLILC